jgi:hypothetical protein
MQSSEFGCRHRMKLSMHREISQSNSIEGRQLHCKFVLEAAL